MIRHFFTTALRGLAANKLQSVIALAGLSLGLAAAIIAGLVIRNQFSFDAFLPLHERLYIVGVELEGGGQPKAAMGGTPYDEAEKLKANFPEIEAIARVSFDTLRFRHGAVQGSERGYSADANIFDLLRLPVLYGDLATALAQPDGIVVPLSFARKYFGADNVVGQTLLVDDVHAMRVTAVVADLPANGTNLNWAIFIPGQAPWSQLSKVDHDPPNGPHKFTVETQTFVRLKPGANLSAVQARIDALNKILLPHPVEMTAKEQLIPITAFHTMRDYTPGVQERLAAFTAVAFVILVLAAINFVNLLIARAARRGREVSMRKAMGASRVALMAQFLGEALVLALIALLLALALVEWTLPAINALLDTGAVLTYGADVAALLIGTLLVGLAAGFYPAIVLSGFRPSVALRGGPLGPAQARLVRRSLVTLQFALLAALVIGTGVLLAQYRFSLTRTLDHADRLLMVSVPSCHGTLADKIGALPGVERTACTDISFVADSNWVVLIKLPNGRGAALNDVTISPGLMGMYDEKIMAGRDLMPSDWMEGKLKPGDPPINILVNQAALGELGLPSAAAAIGHVFYAEDFNGPAKIVGVVPDFSAYALEKPVPPTAYSYRQPDILSPILTVQLASRDNQALLKAIDHDWNQLNDRSLFQRMFLSDWLANERIALLRQGQAFAVCAGIALLLGALGLFGLSVAEAQRRVKEIGVRKAMGAGNARLLTLLLWQFAQPVLWANLIAWPLAWWVMNRWLSGFAFHIAMPLWLFPAAGLATLGIALLTVAAQSWVTARQKPVLTLRYE